MSVRDQLLAETQPGYETEVAKALAFMAAHLGEAIFEDVEKAGFPDRVLQAVATGPARSEAKLGCLNNLSSLSWWCDLPLTGTFQGRQAAVARAICLDLARKIQAYMSKPHPGALASHMVFVGQLVGTTHSPSLGAVEYVRALARDPEVERVVVLHTGALPPSVEAMAQQRWGAEAAKVRWAPVAGEYLATAILEGPYTYHFWCEPALAAHIGILSLFGPSVMFTCADAAPAQFADVYWYCHEPAYIQRSWRLQGAPQAFASNYRQTESAPFDRPTPVRARSRAELGFSPDDTVIVTVGNRLGVEMDQPFVDGMARLVLDRPHVKWLLVGKLPEYWLNAFETVLDRQVAHVAYDADLAGLMTLGDIFANPFRAGGGNSALVAIDAGCVVVTRADLGDVGAFVPTKHRADGEEAYFAEMAALLDTPALREARRAEQQALLARRLDLDHFESELKALRHLAYRRFAKRLPVKMKTIFPPEPPAARLRTG